MVMGNDYRVNIPDAASAGSQSPFRMDSADPGIKKQSGITCFNVDTVSVASRLERYGDHGLLHPFRNDFTDISQSQ
jgi:hypothetical protein